MSHLQTAKNQITRYGYKGSAILKRNTDNYDKATKKNVEILSNPIPLMAYVVRYPVSRINGTSIMKEDRRILIALDNDFDGAIGEDDKINVPPMTDDLSIVDYTVHRIKDSIAYVEVQARG
jgi:hypothetical protein